MDFVQGLSNLWWRKFHHCCHGMFLHVCTFVPLKHSFITSSVVVAIFLLCFHIAQCATIHGPGQRSYIRVVDGYFHNTKHGSTLLHEIPPANRCLEGTCESKPWDVIALCSNDDPKKWRKCHLLVWDNSTCNSTLECSPFKEGYVNEPNLGTTLKLLELGYTEQLIYFQLIYFATARNCWNN